jgi:hypothetical protein
MNMELERCLTRRKELLESREELTIWDGEMCGSGSKKGNELGINHCHINAKQGGRRGRITQEGEMGPLIDSCPHRRLLVA